VARGFDVFKVLYCVISLLGFFLLIIAERGFASEASWSRFEGDQFVSENNYQEPESRPASQRRKKQLSRANIAESSADYSQTGRRYNNLPLSPGSHNLSAEFGQVFMMRDPSDSGNAFGSQFRYTNGVSQLFGFDSLLGYSSHGGGQLRQIHLGGGARINLVRVDRMISYLSSGLGFYQTSLRQQNQISRTSNTAFGLYCGVGVDLIVTKSMFFGAALQFNHSFSGSGAGTYAQILARMGFSL